MTPQPQALVLILGIARSGTSALAGALAQSGVWFGENLKPNDKQNPKGNHEDLPLSRMNQEILRVLGATWSSLAPLPSGWRDRSDIRKFQPIVDAKLSELCMAHSLAGLKDPRLLPLLPLYTDSAERLGLTLRAVGIRRDRSEVIKSIRQAGYYHGWLDPWRARKLYTHYEIMLDQAMTQLRGRTICHRDLLNSPRDTLAPVLNELENSCSDAKLSLESALRWIDPSLHRNKRKGSFR